MAAKKKGKGKGKGKRAGGRGKASKGRGGGKGKGKGKGKKGKGKRKLGGGDDVQFGGIDFSDTTGGMGSSIQATVTPMSGNPVTVQGALPGGQPGQADWPAGAFDGLTNVMLVQLQAQSGFSTSQHAPSAQAIAHASCETVEQGGQPEAVWNNSTAPIG